MEWNFNDQKIDEAIRNHSKRSSIILDLANTTSWITDEKLFYGRESKNKIELVRCKTPFTAILPNLIIVFKKDNLKNPKLRLSIFGYLLLSILSIMLLFVIIKKTIDSNFQGDLFFPIFLLLFFLALLFLEYKLTKKILNKLKQRIIYN